MIFLRKKLSHIICLALPALASGWLLSSRAGWADNRLWHERRAIASNRQLMDAQTGSAFTKQSRDRTASQLQAAYNELLEKVREGEAQVGDLNHRGAIATFNTAIELINDIEANFSASLTENQIAELTRRKAAVFIALGAQHLVLTDYRAALIHTESGLALAQEIGNLPLIAWAWVNLGEIQNLLGQHQQSLDSCRASLSAFELANTDDDPWIETWALSCLGSAYKDQENYQEALPYFEAALQAAREIESLVQEASMLINLGYTYVRLGDYDKAIDALETSAQIARMLDNDLVEAYAIGNLGYAYSFVGRYDEAIALLAKALPAFQAIGHRRGEWLIFSATGDVLARMDKPELAIIFYKQAVEVNEAIRADLVGLPSDVQQSYLRAASGLASIEASYRTLADLLLQTNRVLEAQAVLDLLKVQELDDSLSDVPHDIQRDVQRGDHRPNIGYWDIEEDILRLYGQVLLEGQELARLQDPTNQPLSEAETARRNELQARQQTLRTQFSDWLNYPDVAALLTKLQATSASPIVDLQTQYAQLQRELRELPQTSVIIYPLILEDRLELVLITPDAPPVRYPVAVTADQLRAAVTDYGQILSNPHQPAEPLAQQLYDWLIAPLAADLERVGAETIVYAPDGVLRYVPLAALHDGQHWLAQRYSITHITAASLTNFSDRPRSQHRALAAACAECEFTVSVAGRSAPFQFANLPATETEVSVLAEQIPDTDVLLNSDFSPTNVQNELGSYTILHLATHAAFVPEQPTESFIVFGNGDHVTLETIRRSWFLANADLVVLSACETAVGSVELGTGIEILGMGYQIQTAGAKSALASLWQVSDGGTQVLMNTFYAALNQGLTKAAALSAAQTAMLSDSVTVVGGARARVAVLDKDGQRVTAPQDMSHPYYWASFILIGNGL